MKNNKLLTKLKFTIMGSKFLLQILGFVVLVFGIALIFALPIMLLWNWLMPDLFGLVTISFWQALGIGMLSGILFKPISND